MPLISLLSIATAAGISAAMAGRVELRVSPRAPLLSRAFGAYCLFAAIVLVPVSVYFYVFHGDWFLFYLADVHRIPSAIAMVGFLGHIGLGALGFLLGAALIRNQRDAFALGAIGVVLGGAGVVALLFRERLAVVGSHAQFHRSFGLVPIGESPVIAGAVVMGAAVVAGWLAMLIRVHLSGRRRRAG